MRELKGAPVSAAIKEQVMKALEEMERLPMLAIVRVGENPDDISYERGAVKKLSGFGLGVRTFHFPADIGDGAFKEAFEAINRDPEVDGILVLRPLPGQICGQDIERMIDPAKDLDGISPVNVAKVFSGDRTGFAPCTAEAVIELLRFYGIPIAGKRATVVGRSMVVGRPLSMLLLQENATVTVCHTRTEDLRAACRQAEILVAAAGKARMLDGTYVGDGSVVIDVGINVDEAGGLCGDLDYGSVLERASMATPVPGGIGTVTTAVLANHLIRAASAK